MGWLWHVLGVDEMTSPWYAFWSGFGGSTPLFGALFVLLRRCNCHARGCWRIGVHHVAGTHYVVCHRHHPDHPGTRAATAEQITRHRRTGSPE